jgi:hypothetical protein
MDLKSNNGGKKKHVVYLMYIFTIVHFVDLLLRYSIVRGHYGIQIPRSNFASFEYKMTKYMNCCLIS